MKSSTSSPAVPAPDSQRFRARQAIRVWPLPVAALAIVAVLAAFGAHWPNLAIFAELSPLTKVHVLAALAALLLGGILLTLRKGRAFHRFAGWGWAGIMATVAISSLFITSINPGHFTLIHAISGWILIALPLAVRAARRHDIKVHRRFMLRLFYGGLIVAGLFTFLPGRAMFKMFFG